MIFNLFQNHHFLHRCINKREKGENNWRESLLNMQSRRSAGERSSLIAVLPSLLLPFKNREM